MSADLFSLDHSLSVPMLLAFLISIRQHLNRSLITPHHYLSLAAVLMRHQISVRRFKDLLNIPLRLVNGRQRRLVIVNHLKRIAVVMLMIRVLGGVILPADERQHDRLLRLQLSRLVHCGRCGLVWQESGARGCG